MVQDREPRDKPTHLWSPNDKGGKNMQWRKHISVQLLSHVQLFVTPWTIARQASLSITNSRNPPKPMSIESVMPSSQWWHDWLRMTDSSSVIPFSSCPQSFSASGSFSNESALHIRWPKYWSFSFNISPSNEHPGLISFRMDWFDLLAVLLYVFVGSLLGVGLEHGWF